MAKVAFPARCAVAVVCGEHLVSQVYPAAVPVEVFVDNIVELLNDDLKRRGLTGLESGIGYELHKANGVRLDVTKTLDELGVEDGATLVLLPAVQGDSFEPQYESLSTGLARVGKKLFEPVTAATAAHAALAILAMIAASVLGLAVRNRVADDSMVPSIVTGVLGVLVLVRLYSSLLIIILEEIISIKVEIIHIFHLSLARVFICVTLGLDREQSM